MQWFDIKHYVVSHRFQHAGPIYPCSCNILSKNLASKKYIIVNYISLWWKAYFQSILCNIIKAFRWKDGYLLFPEADTCIHSPAYWHPSPQSTVNYLVHPRQYPHDFVSAHADYNVAPQSIHHVHALYFSTAFKWSESSHTTLTIPILKLQL